MATSIDIDSLSSIGSTLNALDSGELTAALMDAIISNSAIRTLYKGVMLGGSAAAAILTNGMYNQMKSVQTALGTTGLLGGVTTSVSISSLVSLSSSAVSGLASAASTALASKFNNSAQNTATQLLSLLNYTMQMPNIQSIPIASAQITVSREIEIGEQLMIVQSSSSKKYWVDNAVPRLKEWNIEGYIMATLPVVDSLSVIRPSITLQLQSLDEYAVSRRPVLFKDDRNNFQFAFITRYEVISEASTNNAVKVSITLKEYKPFEVENSSITNLIAEKVS